MQFTLASLPPDVLRHCCHFLPGSSVGRLREVCSAIKETLSDDNLWKFLLRRDFFETSQPTTTYWEAYKVKAHTAKNWEKNRCNSTEVKVATVAQSYLFPTSIVLSDPSENLSVFDSQTLRLLFQIPSRGVEFNGVVEDDEKLIISYNGGPDGGAFLTAFDKKSGDLLFHVNDAVTYALSPEAILANIASPFFGASGGIATYNRRTGQRVNLSLNC